MDIVSLKFFTLLLVQIRHHNVEQIRRFTAMLHKLNFQFELYLALWCQILFFLFILFPPRFLEFSNFV